MTSEPLDLTEIGLEEGLDQLRRRLIQAGITQKKEISEIIEYVKDHHQDLHGRVWVSTKGSPTFDYRHWRKLSPRCTVYFIAGPGHQLWLEIHPPR